MKLSVKKKDALYSVVHEDIMQARIKIARLLHGNPKGVFVDNILYDLAMNAPQKALDIFEK